MLFNSYVFIFLFLPLALAGWMILNKCRQYKLAQGYLIGMSLWFYAYFNVSFLWVIAGSCLFNYGLSLILSKKDTPKMRKTLMLLGCLGNLGALGYFKYCNFFLENINALFRAGFQMKNILLPLGISFFTFQQLSFLIDRCRGEAPHYGLLDYLSFVTFFPSLISGPIVLHAATVSQFRDISRRHFDEESFAKGVMQFTMGLGKKVLLADTLMLAVNYGYENIGSLDTVSALLTACFYTLELYFDFSGYSDMAIGLASMFGFRFGKNFDYPYVSQSITEFWRRWHISLGAWFRDYVYIPCGGSRAGTVRTIANLLLVWLLTGIWHGANWTFLLWGVYYGILLLLEKFVLRRALEHLPGLLRHVLTLLLVLIGWVFFFSSSPAAAFGWIGRMFGSGSALVDATAKYYLAGCWPLLLVGAIGSFPVVSHVGTNLLRRSKAWQAFSVVLFLALLLLCIALMMNDTYSTFLYFQF